MKLINFILILAFLKLTTCQLNPLEEYVYDDSDISVVKSDLISIKKESEYTRYKLNITTLKWFDETFSSSSIWYHDMFIAVPKNLDPNNSIFFFIDSGKNNNTLNNDEGSNLPYVSSLSVDCKCITAVLRQVPNQPFSFNIDPTKKQRVEDDLIAFTFNLYLNKKSQFPDATYNHLPLLAPMTKAAKRGMDLVVEHLNELDIKFSEKFVVSGISKRGWTSWLITAIDPRVIACVPIVFDVLNWNKILHVHYMSMGGAYSFALQDYFVNGLTPVMDSYKFYELSKIIDPYTFIERYKGKKIMMILSSNDEFMLPENSKMFWREISIQTNFSTYIRRIPNLGHYIQTKEPIVFANVKSFLYLLSQKNTNAFPKLTWNFKNDLDSGKINIKLTNLNQFKSYEIRGYSALTLSNKRVDFRMHVLNGTQIVYQEINWKSKIIESNQIKRLTITQSFEQKRALAKSKYIGFFIEVRLNFKDEAQNMLVLSTNINIMPEYYPTFDCNEQECLGKLV